MNRQPYPNELYHYGVLGMRWGHRKARIEQRKERQRKYSIDHPVKSAIGSGLKTWGALTAAGVGSALIATALLKSPALSAGKIRAAGVLSKIGGMAATTATGIGAIAAVRQYAINDKLRKENKS